MPWGPFTCQAALPLTCLRGYQATGPLASKYPPVGPSGRIRAIRTMISAPSAAVWVPVPPLRSVAV